MSNRIIMSREELEMAVKYIDVFNPKFELNYLNIDKKYIFSTNTTALFYMEHNTDIEENFSIHKELVSFALKIRKAKSFALFPNKIMCLDIDSNEILSISKDEDTKEFKLLKIENIISKTFKKEIAFTNYSQVNGILALNKTIINEKYIPKENNADDYLMGIVCINNPFSPIEIKTKNINIVIMPIVEKIPYFNETEYDAYFKEEE